MRIVLAATALLALAACEVKRDDQNDTTTVQFNEAVAANGLEQAGDTARNVASDAANEAKQIGDKVENEVGDVDVDVDVSRNKQ